MGKPDILIEYFIKFISNNTKQQIQRLLDPNNLFKLHFHNLPDTTHLEKNRMEKIINFFRNKATGEYHKEDTQDSNLQ